MVGRQPIKRPGLLLFISLICLTLTAQVAGSLGDRLPDFKECVSVEFAPALVVLIAIDASL